MEDKLRRSFLFIYVYPKCSHPVHIKSVLTYYMFQNPFIRRAVKRYGNEVRSESQRGTEKISRNDGKYQETIVNIRKSWQISGIDSKYQAVMVNIRAQLFKINDVIS